MKQTQKVITRFPIESDLEIQNIKRLSDLINEVYDNAESGMWKRTGIRTNPAEVERLLRAQALVLAEIDSQLIAMELRRIIHSAEERTRTSTRLPLLAPEAIVLRRAKLLRLIKM
jgi:hypothetical protein